MKINRNSTYKWMIKNFRIFVIFFVIIWTAFLIITKLYFGLIILFILSIFYLVANFCSCLGVADIELDEDSFYVITFFNKVKILYNDFIIYDIIRYYRRDFAIYSNYKNIRVAYTEDNYANIKTLFFKTKSKYSLNQFENMVNNSQIKPGFWD